MRNLMVSLLAAAVLAACGGGGAEPDDGGKTALPLKCYTNPTPCQ